MRTKESATTIATFASNAPSEKTGLLLLHANSSSSSLILDGSVKHYDAIAQPLSEGENPFAACKEKEEVLVDEDPELLLAPSEWKQAHLLQHHNHLHHHGRYESWKANLKLALVFFSGVLATAAWAQLFNSRAAGLSSGYSAYSPYVFSRISTLFRPSAAKQTLPVSFGIAKGESGAGAISSLGRTVHFNGIYYYVPGKPKSTFTVKRAPDAWTESSFFPLTVVQSAEQTFGEVHIDRISATYAAEDDVWTPGFMRNIFLQYSGAKGDYAALDASISAYTNSSFLLSGYGARRGSKAVQVAAAEPLPAGPYFASLRGDEVSLYEAWRLYGDQERAFYYGIVPHQHDQSAFDVLPSSLPETNGVAAIGVPSRLYYTKTADKPLAGVRVSVKDIYNIKGLKTSMSSRAWLSLYPAAASTAPSVQRLIDLGAIIVGKTRTSQFANGEYGTADSVDFSVPFNVRGDNYQDPSSSSSGSGSAAAAYGFIDLHVGSDTGGSVRGPAALNGVYGNRPSQGAVDLSGVLPLSPGMDTAALLGLDAKRFAEYSKLFYGSNNTFKSYPSFPKKLLYLVDPAPEAGEPSPGFFPAQNPGAAPVYEQFVQLLEAFLGTRRVEVDFYARFKRRFGVYPPAYIGPAWSLLTAYDQYHLVGKHFDAEYAAANEGDRPFVDPPVRANWELAKSLTVAERTFYLKRKQDFTDFISDELMARDSDETCSNALTIFPLVGGRPSYKSDYHLATAPFKGFNRFGISQLGQVPEVVIPLADVPYFSKLTQSTKHLPVSISIQAAHGCDFVLYDLISELADAGIIRNPTAGTSRTFADSSV